MTRYVECCSAPIAGPLQASSSLAPREIRIRIIPLNGLFSLALTLVLLLFSLLLTALFLLVLITLRLALLLLLIGADVVVTWALGVVLRLQFAHRNSNCKIGTSVERVRTTLPFAY
jgi:hypothetical protein